MKVRVWISGEEGPSHDFELLDAPRVGEQVSIALSDRTEDGIVISVSWHLQGIERPTGDLSIDGDPIGTVRSFTSFAAQRPHNPREHWKAPRSIPRKRLEAGVAWGLG